MTTDSEQSWEDCYVRGETPWDKGAAAPGLVAYLAGKEVRGRVLVPGCGLGHDVRVLARGGAEVVGLDISATALRRAEAMEKTGGERYVQGDFFALEPKFAGAFDWIWEHTCFCAIDPARRRDYVRAAAGALKPGGRLLGVFYLDPYDDDHRPGGGPPHGCTVAELESLFGAAFKLVESWAPGQTYAGREGRERMMLMVRRP